MREPGQDGRSASALLGAIEDGDATRMGVAHALDERGGPVGRGVIGDQDVQVLAKVHELTDQLLDVQGLVVGRDHDQRAAHADASSRIGRTMAAMAATSSSVMPWWEPM